MPTLTPTLIDRERNAARAAVWSAGWGGGLENTQSYQCVIWNQTAKPAKPRNQIHMRAHARVRACTRVWRSKMAVWWFGTGTDKGNIHMFHRVSSQTADQTATKPQGQTGLVAGGE